MAKIFNTILFTGNETPKETAQKMGDFQRQTDNRISALEKKIEDIDERVEELEE